MRTASPEVVIIGGGPVGILLACLLATQGRRPLVLERRTTAFDGSRAIGIHPPGLAALDAAGVGEAIRAESAVIRRGVVVYGGRVLAALRFDGDEIRSLPQQRTLCLLEEQLSRLAPGALRRGAEAVDLREEDDGMAVDVVQHGVSSTVRARYVVGADGVRSGVRELLGIGWRSRPGSADYVMVDTPEPADAPDTAMLHFEAAGVVESFPLADGGRRWVVWTGSRESAPDAAMVAALIEARIPARLDRSLLGRSSPFSARQHLADAFARGRVALVGDAAHEVSPIGGQGMNLGWLDVRRLADVLVEALGDGAPPSPFASYARERRRSAQRAMRQAAFNMWMGAPRSGLALGLRNAAVRTLAHGPANRYLVEAFTMRRL